MGIPDPLKDLPSISMLIGILRTSPVNSQCVCRLSMPEVPSKICRIKTPHYLDHSSLASNFKYLSFSHTSISKSYVYNLCISLIL